MPLVQAKCPSCGATLEVDNAKEAAICPYCQSAYIVEKAIVNITGESNNTINASVVNVYTPNEADYVIRAGKLERYNGSSTDVVIPDNVTVIGEEAFKGCSALTRIVIPDNITAIEDAAFEGCRSLKEFVLSGTVKSFGFGIFKDCPNIEVQFADNVAEIADFLFSYSSFSTIKLPSGITKIGKKAFIENKNLEKVILPDTVARIEDDAFNECFHLKYINMPRNLEYIGEAAFAMCQNITEIKLPTGFKEIGPRAFASCVRLKTIEIPNSTQKIGDRAFYACSELCAANIPAGVSVGQDIFMLAGGFPELNVSMQGKTEIDKLLDSGQKVMAIKILRDETGLGLAEAKNEIDKYELKRNGISGAEGPSSQATSPSQSKSGGCYVATSVYGSYDCPQVWTLRRYRDYRLAKTWYGRTFIKAYYATSPSLVKWFGETSWFRSLWKGVLDKKVTKLNEIGFEDTPYNDPQY